jgi:hypothetical protein
VTVPGAMVIHDMAEEIPYILPYLTPFASEGELRYAFAISFSWRWKFALISAQTSRLQTYDAVTGKARYGVSLIEVDNYVCGEDFVSFSSQISKLYRTGYVIRNNEGSEDMPCDEPPSDTEIPVVENVTWLCRTAMATLTTNDGQLPNSFCADIGSKVTFYPQPAVTGYIFGGSYVYDIAALYTQAQYENFLGRPPAINV